MHNKNLHKSSADSDLTHKKVQQALASLSLEGLHLSKESSFDLDLMLSHKITKEEFLSRCINRATEPNEAKK